MRVFRGGQNVSEEAADITTDNARQLSGGLGATLLSAIAVIFSGYSLWDSALRSADLSIYVPRVIYYAAPYTNSNLEIIQVPVTITNDGAQTGTVLHLDLAVTDPRTKQTKHFYAAEFGVWSMERTRTRSYRNFAPLSLAGRESRTETVLFYTRGDDEKPDQIIREVGPYEFKLTATLAKDTGGIEAMLGKAEETKPISVAFERMLPFYDARAFDNGTIYMPAKDWTSSSSN